MQFGLLSNLMDPAILFFFFGLFAILVKSNLEIPPAIGKFLSLYLLMALGIKGGVAMSKSGFGSEVLYALSAALLMAALVPLYSYFILRQNKKVSAFDAAAIAATYGSVSAVTFIVGSGFLSRQGIEPSGYMTAAMVVMESPASSWRCCWQPWFACARKNCLVTSPKPGRRAVLRCRWGRFFMKRSQTVCTCCSWVAC
jgi:hypothetical protein